MKLYLSLALLLGSIIVIAIGYETKKIRVKRSAMRKPHGFITIEMDNDHPSGGWGSGWSGGSSSESSGWGQSKSSGGWGDQGGIRMSIKMNKKIDLGRILSMMSMEPDDGWGDDSSSGWGGGSSGYSSGGGGGYGNSGSGGHSNGWSYGGGNSGYRRGAARVSRRS